MWMLKTFRKCPETRQRPSFNVPVIQKRGLISSITTASNFEANFVGREFQNLVTLHDARALVQHFQVLWPERVNTVCFFFFVCVFLEFSKDKSKLPLFDWDDLFTAGSRVPRCAISACPVCILVCNFNTCNVFFLLLLLLLCLKIVFFQVTLYTLHSAVASVKPPCL